jgi:hypothetical protein
MEAKNEAKKQAIAAHAAAGARAALIAANPPKGKKK